MMNYATGSTEKGRSVHTEDYVFSSYVDTVRNLCLCRRDSVFNVTVGLSRDGMEQISSHNKEIRDSETRRIMDSSRIKRNTLLSCHCQDLQMKIQRSSYSNIIRSRTTGISF